MSSKPSRLERNVRDFLKGQSLPWEIRLGGKHHKVYIKGKMVMTFSHGAQSSRDIVLLKSIVRKITDADN